MPEPTTSPPASSSPVPRVARAWAVWAQVPLLLAAAALAIALGREHLLISHGQAGACLWGTDCGAMHASGWAELSGVPISLWAPPIYLVIAMLLPVASRASVRGRRARGAVTALAMACVLASLVLLGGMLFDVRQLNGPALLLDLLHLGILTLALVPRGGKRLAFPEVDDWLPAMLVGMTAIMAFGSGARIVAGHLERDLEAQGPAPSLDLPPETRVATSGVARDAIEVPTPRSPVPIDDQDAAVGPHRADVTAVAFVDLLDPASQQLTWSLIELEERWSDRVRFVYKQLPMDTACNPKRQRTASPGGCEVAVAVQCAREQHGFVPYRRLVLRNPQAIDDATLVQHARRIGLDLDAFAACRSGDLGLDAVEADVKQASKAPLGDPPWLFIEGRVLEGVPDPAVIELTLGVALGEQEVDAEGRGVPVARQVVDQPPVDGPAPAVAVADFFIDAVEASLDAEGTATRWFGQPPHAVSLEQARSACQAAGRRLCTRAEWVTACQGAPVVDDDGDGELFDDLREGRLHPYGDAPHAGWCAEGDLPGATASHPACRTPEGIYDLEGNMAEWVDEGVLVGGGDGAPQDLGCYAAWTPPGPGWRSPGTGFRCCSDPPPTASTTPPVAPPVLPAAQLPAPLEGPVVLVAWQLDCLSCQHALRSASQLELPTLLLDLGGDPAGTALWLEHAGVQARVVADPDALLAGQLGLDGPGWMGLYDAEGHLLAAFDEDPGTPALQSASKAP